MGMINKCVEAIPTIGLRSNEAVRGHSSFMFDGCLGKGVERNKRDVGYWDTER